MYSLACLGSHLATDFSLVSYLQNEFANSEAIITLLLVEGPK